MKGKKKRKWGAGGKTRIKEKKGKKERKETGRRSPGAERVVDCRP